MAKIVVTARIIPQKARNIELQARAKITDLLKLLNLNPEVVAVRRNGKIVVEEERLADGDLVEIIPVVTGG